MSTDQYRNRLLAIEIMDAAGSIDPRAIRDAQFALAALEAKDAGLTAEGLTEELNNPDTPHRERYPLLIMAINAPLTDLARAAIRLADEHPEIDELDDDTARSIARDYLPEGAEQ